MSFDGWMLDVWAERHKQPIHAPMLVSQEKLARRGLNAGLPTFADKNL